VVSQENGILLKSENKRNEQEQPSVAAGRKHGAGLYFDAYERQPFHIHPYLSINLLLIHSSQFVVFGENRIPIRACTQGKFDSYF